MTQERDYGREMRIDSYIELHSAIKAITKAISHIENVNTLIEEAPYFSPFEELISTAELEQVFCNLVDKSKLVEN